MKLDIWNTEGSRVWKSATVEDAAALMELDEGEVEWAIEEYGRCDTEGFIAVPEGEREPNPLEEPMVE